MPNKLPNIRKCVLSVVYKDNASNNNKRGCQSGFSLLEVLITTALIAVIAVGFLNAINTANRSVRTIEEHMFARNLATSFIERIRNEPFLEDYDYVQSSITRPFQYDVDIELKYSDDGGDTWSDNFSSTNLQRITIVVKRGDRPVLSSCDYKIEL